MPESFSPTLSDIRKVLKPVDAWWVVLVVDPIAMRVLWLLTRIWPELKPTTVTVASLLLGVASAYLFSLGEQFFVLAAIVFQLSFLLDCIDGRLARLRGLTSRAGALLDGLVNVFVFGANVLGLMVAFRDDISFVFLGALLLFVWAVHIFLNLSLLTEDHHAHSPFLGNTEGWLGRHRLLPPMTFPDKHAVMFLLGPVTGFVVWGVAAVTVIEIVSLAVKVPKALRVA